MGDEPTHWEVVGQIPPQGGPHANREATSTWKRCRVDIQPTRGRDGECGIAGGGDIHLAPLEHSNIVYCDQAHYGPVSGSVLETRGRVLQAVVGSGRGEHGGDADGSLVGEMDRRRRRIQTGQRRRLTKSVGR